MRCMNTHAPEKAACICLEPFGGMKDYAYGDLQNLI